MDDRETRARLERIAFEITYWQAALEDIASLNDQLTTVAEDVLASTAGIAETAILTAVTAPPTSETVIRSGRHLTAAMRALRAMQEGPLRRLLELAQGRQLALAQDVREAQDGIDSDPEPHDEKEDL